MSFPGFMDAKCLAASKPRPMLAPTTRMVWPVRSARRTGGTGVNWSLTTWKKENFMVGGVGGSILGKSQKVRQFKISSTVWAAGPSGY